MKKVLGVAFMPEELAGNIRRQIKCLYIHLNMYISIGEYRSLSNLSPRELGECFDSEIFSLSGDSWAKDTSLIWPQGSGD